MYVHLCVYVLPGSKDGTYVFFCWAGTVGPQGLRGEVGLPGVKGKLGEEREIESILWRPLIQEGPGTEGSERV